MNLDFEIDNIRFNARASAIIYNKDNDFLDNYKTFIAPVDGLFYIKLKKDEKIYYPK